MIRINSYMLTALLSIVTLTACGTLPQEVKDLPKRGTEPELTESLDTSSQRTSQALRQAHQLLSMQDYTGTINLIQEEIHKGANEQSLAKEYLLAANHNLNQANALMEPGDYQKAGLLFKTVQDSYPRSHELQEQLPASPEQLADKINLCMEKLMEAGLTAYRTGEFVTAIDVWQQVLEFNPQHQAAQDSIQTTKLQLSNLKTLDGKY